MDQAREEILDRSQPHGDIKVVLEEMSTTVDQVVNYGTNLIPLLDGSAKGFGELSVLALTLEAVEKLDGVAVLLRHACAEPCKPLLRSIMEAVFGVEFMMEKDTDRRGVAYQVQHAHSQMALYERMDSHTNAGKDFRKSVAADKSVGEFSLPDIESPALCNNLRKMLARPEYAPIEAEWQAFLKGERSPTGKKNKPYWYQLFNGPASVRDLAKHLKKDLWYDVLYRDFSTDVHAAGALGGVHPRADGSLAYTPIRYPKNAPAYFRLGVSMALHLYRCLLQRYCSGNIAPFDQWYLREIAPPLRKLSAVSFNDPDRATKSLPFRSSSTCADAEPPTR